MPSVDASFGWTAALTALAGVALAAFVVAWIVTDVAHVARTPYVGVLVMWVAGLVVAALAWSGASATAFITTNVEWALVAGVVAAAMSLPLVRRMPRSPHERGGALARTIAWEGVAYAAAEGVLLAALPVALAWVAFRDLGWTDGTWARVGSGALAVAAAVAVVLVHHLGYREFRSRGSRTKLAGALVVCGLQAVAFLVTGNVLAPVIAHVVLHIALVLRGVEMPPAARGTLIEMPSATGVHAPRAAQHDVA